jgi:prepilin-type N-terminal cleavage/methylation domain-containing protein
MAKRVTERLRSRVYLSVYRFVLRPAKAPALTTDPTCARRHREMSGNGFTLIEFSVVLAIIAVLSAMSYTYFEGTKSSITFSSASLGLVADLRKVRSDSYGSGYTAVFVFNQTTGQYWGIEDVTGTFNLATFDPSNPAPPPAKLLVQNWLNAPIVVGPSTGYGATLPQPFASVHVDNACTFCQSTALPPYGAVSFLGRDGTSFTGPNAGDGSLTIQTPQPTGGWAFITIAIIGRTGAIDSFNGSHS